MLRTGNNAGAVAAVPATAVGTVGAMGKHDATATAHLPRYLTLPAAGISAPIGSAATATAAASLNGALPVGTAATATAAASLNGALHETAKGAPETAAVAAQPALSKTAGLKAGVHNPQQDETNDASAVCVDGSCFLKSKLWVVPNYSPNDSLCNLNGNCG